MQASSPMRSSGVSKPATLSVPTTAPFTPTDASRAGIATPTSPRTAEPKSKGATPRSVLGRELLGMIDNHDGNRDLLPLQLEAELVLERPGESGSASVGPHRVGNPIEV